MCASTEEMGTSRSDMLDPELKLQLLEHPRLWKKGILSSPCCPLTHFIPPGPSPKPPLLLCPPPGI